MIREKQNFQFSNFASVQFEDNRLKFDSSFKFEPGDRIRFYVLSSQGHAMHYAEIYLSEVDHKWKITYGSE